jgi:hypothetical protein
MTGMAPLGNREVTVIMAAHNAGAYIGESIRGVLEQSYPHFQLLVVDDCSTDSTRDIVRSQTDPRIRLIALENNVGPGAARNVAIRAAETDLVANNDADDVSYPERLERQVSFMRANPRCALLGSALEEVRDDGTPAGSYHVPPCDPALVKWRLLTHNVIGNSSAMFRREAALRAGGYDETLRFAEDYALWIALAATAEVANLPDMLVRYRLNSAGLTAMHPDPLGLASAAVAQRAFRLAVDRTVSLEAVRCLQGTLPPRSKRGPASREAARAIADALIGMVGDGSATQNHEAELLEVVRKQMRDLCSASPASTPYVALTFSRLATRLDRAPGRRLSSVLSSLPLLRAGLGGIVAYRRDE